MTHTVIMLKTTISISMTLRSGLQSFILADTLNYVINQDWICPWHHSMDTIYVYIDQLHVSQWMLIGYNRHIQTTAGPAQPLRGFSTNTKENVDHTHTHTRTHFIATTLHKHTL